MLRSMYTGISGMRGFQSKLDVVSNDIANVNTYGYKKGRITFSDMMSQTIQGATAPNDNLGGRNPKQVGLGVNTGSIDNIHTQGNIQTTNRPLDLAIQGDGMFVVAQRTSTAGDNDNYINLANDDISFTRAGNFYLDNNGYIVNSNGQYLVGRVNETDNDGTPDDNNGDGTVGTSSGRIKIPAGAQSFSIGADGTVSYVPASGGAPLDAGQIQLAKFSNPGGLEKVGGNLFKATDNAGLIVEDSDNDGDATDEAFDSINDLSTPGNNGTGELFAGALEMSNVDLAEEFTEMITAQRGFQANTRVITTSDEILQELVNLKR